MLSRAKLFQGLLIVMTAVGCGSSRGVTKTPPPFGNLRHADREGYSARPIIASPLRFSCCLLTVFVLAGCGSPALSSTRTSAQAVTPTTAQLLARPLRLPQVAPGAPCPAAPVADVNLGIASPRGGRVFYLGGPPPKGAFAFNKTVFAVAGARGPVLLRGGRLDGPGTLKFDGHPADPKLPAETVTSAGGISATFYTAVLSAAPINEGGIGGAADVLYFYPSTSGCYAVQADGGDFANVVVFVAAA